jgi:hypothetical protein
MNDEPISDKERRKLHAMIRDIAKQVRFDGQWWDEEEWKLFLFAAAFGQRVVKNPSTTDSPVVVNKKRTRNSSVSNGAELITQLYAFGNERDVKWSIRSGRPRWSSTNNNRGWLHDDEMSCLRYRISERR